MVTPPAAAQNDSGNCSDTSRRCRASWRGHARRLAFIFQQSVRTKSRSDARPPRPNADAWIEAQEITRINFAGMICPECGARFKPEEKRKRAAVRYRPHLSSVQFVEPGLKRVDNEKSALQSVEREPRSRHCRIRCDAGRYFSDRGGYASPRGIPGKQRIFKRC